MSLKKIAKQMGIKKIPKVRFKRPYIKKLYGKVYLKPHVIREDAIDFDLSFTIPADLGKKAGKHFAKNKFKYEILGSGASAFVGAKIAQPRKKRRKRK